MMTANVKTALITVTRGALAKLRQRYSLPYYYNWTHSILKLYSDLTSTDGGKKQLKIIIIAVGD